MQNQDILSRDNTLWMQGVSAIIIMAMHFVMQLDNYPRALNILGSIGVAVFLFVSGFGINESYKASGLKGFWRKRLLRVILPCWMVLLFKLPFTEGFDLKYHLLNFFFIDSELWFVDFIIRWYIVYWMARKLLPAHTGKVLAAFGVACVFMEQLMSEQAFSFFAGYITSEHYSKIRQWSKARVAKTAAAAFAYGTLFTVLKEFQFIRQYIGTLPFNIILLNIKLPLATAIIAAPYVMPWVRKIRFISWIGKISYEVYIVHYNFMGCITGWASIVKFTAISLVISEVFNKVNLKLKDARLTVDTLAALAYITICYILACKYAMRVTDAFGYACLAYILVLGLLFLMIVDGRLKFGGKAKPVFWIGLCTFVAFMLAVQYHFDPMENRVDRWSAIANPLTAMFNGKFPYLAETHLGGNASPFPVWMAFHIPFWALGNVGLSEIFTAVVFVLSIRRLGGYDAGIKAVLLLAVSINLWYETAVRSDLISNFLLLAAFINILAAKGVTFDKHPYALSAAAGLWLSTRVSTAFPLFILFFPYWLKLPAGKKVMTVLTVLAVFCATFLPLVAWDADSLFFAENNPFSLQGRQGRPADTVIMAAIAVIMALKWKGDFRLATIFSATMLILVPVVAYTHNMYVYDNWTEVFGGKYDITYLDAALPFLVTILAMIKHQPRQAKKPNL